MSNLTLASYKIETNGVITNIETGKEVHPLHTRVGKRPTVGIRVMINSHPQVLFVWVSHLVALIHLEKPEYEVNLNYAVEHIDGNVENVNSSNLRWVSGIYKNNAMNKTVEILNLLEEQAQAMQLVTGQGKKFEELPMNLREQMMKSLQGAVGTAVNLSSDEIETVTLPEPTDVDIVDGEFTEVVRPEV